MSNPTHTLPAHLDPFGPDAAAWFGYHTGHSDAVLGEHADLTVAEDGAEYVEAYRKGHEDGTNAVAQVRRDTMHLV